MLAIIVRRKLKERISEILTYSILFLLITMELFGAVIYGDDPFEPNIRVNELVPIPSTSAQSDPSIIVDNAGNIYVVWEDARDGNLDIYFAKSTDGGNTFSPNKKVNDDNGDKWQFNPSIAVDGIGNIYIAWTDYRDELDGDIYFANSTDGGNSFSANKKVNDDAGNVGQDSPSVSVGSAMDIYITWMDYRNTDSDIYFANSTDGGNSFSVNKKVNDDTGNTVQFTPSIIVKDSNDIWITWMDYRNSDSDIYFTKSTDGGNSFSANKKVNDDPGNAVQEYPSISVDSSDNIYIVWRDNRNSDYDIYFAKSMDGGNSFSANKMVNDDVVNAEQYEPSVTVDGTGILYIAWRDERNGNSDIYFANSTDGGNSFSINNKVNDDAVNAGQYEPSVAADGTDTVFIAWMDNRNGNYDIYFANSTDGGNSFSINNKVNDDDFIDPGQYEPSIAVDNGGNIYLAWTDERNGNYDIYFANSTDGGNTFSANKKVNDDIGNMKQQDSSIAVDIAGNIYLAWRDERMGSFGDIYFANSTDGGNTFSTNKKVNDDIINAGQYEPSITVDNTGNIYIVWMDNRSNNYDIYFAKSIDGGNTFLMNKKVNDDVGSAKQQSPSITVDGLGNIYIAWMDYRNSNYDIYFSKSLDGGNTFSTNKIVNDDSGDKRQQDPSIDVDDTGTIYVVWGDNRNIYSDIYFAKSIDGGNTFSVNNKVNDDVGDNYQQDPSTTIDGAGNVYVVWTDNRNGKNDIYLARYINGRNKFSENYRVNDNIGNINQFSPSLTVDNVGNIYVAWEDNRNSSSDIYFTLCEPIPAPIITEIQDSPDGNEWIEVFNPVPLSLNLLEYKISLNLGMTFINGTWSNPVIDFGEYSVWTPNASGIINDEGAIISIHNVINPKWPMFDVISYGQKGTTPDPLTGESTERYWDIGLSIYTDFWSRNESTGPTLGAVNNNPGVNPNPLVIINEVCYYPSLPEYGFIELIYIGDTSIDISNYKIVCDSEYIIPSGTILSKDNPYYELISANYPISFDLDNGVVNGDNIYLYDETNTLLDMVGWSSSHAINKTVSRVPNGFGTHQGFNNTTSFNAGWRFDQTPSIHLIWVYPNMERYDYPGQSVVYNLSIQNKHNNNDLIDINNVSNPWGWDVTIMDNNSNLLLDSNGNGFPDISISAGDQVNIKIKVTIPIENQNGFSETTMITVQSTLNPSYTDNVTLITKGYMGPLENITFPIGSFIISMDNKQNDILKAFGFAHALLRNGSAIHRIIEPPNISIKTTTAPGGAVYYGGPILVLPDNASILINVQLSFPTVSVDTLTESFTSPFVYSVVEATDILLINVWPIGDGGHTERILDDMDIPYTNITRAQVESNPSLIGPPHSLVIVDGPGWTQSPSGVANAIRTLVENGGEAIFNCYSIPNMIQIFPGYMNGSRGSGGINRTYTFHPLSEFPAQYFGPDTVSFRRRYAKMYSIHPDVRSVLTTKNSTYRDAAIYFPYGNKGGIVQATIFEPGGQTIGSESRLFASIYYGNKFIHLTPQPEFPNILPPTLNINVSQDKEDAILYWDPPSTPFIDHYLIYRSTSQTDFDFNSVWVNTSKDKELGELNPIPLRTMWNDTNAAVPGHPNFEKEYYYLIRAVDGGGRTSKTSRTVGKWTRTFPQGVSTFSLPLEPLGSFDTEWYTSNMNAEYIKYMNTTTHTWMQHNFGDGNTNNTQMKLGEGYEVKFNSQTNYTFTGMPGAMILYDNVSFGFDAAVGVGEADSLSATVDTISGTVTLNWSLPSNVGSGDEYFILRSNSRDGFWDVTGLDYIQLASLPYNVISYQDIGNATAGTEYYYMIVPVNKSTNKRGSSSYSIGIWTEEFLNQYDTFGIPLKMNNNHSADWFCDNIPDSVGINYFNYSQQRWSWHSRGMSEGAFDPILEMTKGYQISTSFTTKFTFIGV